MDSLAVYPPPATILTRTRPAAEEVAMKEVEWVCPQCGETVERLNEGYCDDCHEERQSALNEHNARFDFWEKCTDKERDFYIKSAAGI